MGKTVALNVPKGVLTETLPDGAAGALGVGITVGFGVGVRVGNGVGVGDGVLVGMTVGVGAKISIFGAIGE